MLKEIELDTARESYPYCLYKKIGFIHFQENILFPIDYGYHFNVVRMSARWSSQNVNIPGIYANPLLVEFFKNAGQMALQNVAFSLSLMSTPGESGIQVDTAPGANPAYPQTARPVNMEEKLDALYFFRDVLHIKISNVTLITVAGDPNGSLPAYLELFIQGRNYPVLNQSEWKK